MEEIKKRRRESGSALFIMVATITVLGVIGLVLGSLISRHHGAVPTNMDSSRAFAIAQSGVEYIGKYLEGADFTTVANPPVMPLGTGSFTAALSGVSPSQIMATITGVSGSAARRITVRYRKGGAAILSRGPINPMNNPNGSVVCDATTSCNTYNIHDCACTRENVPASVIPDLPVPSPQPGAPPGGCDVNSNQTLTAGTYYCTNYRIRNNTDVILSPGAVVTIFCDTFSIENQGTLNWNAGSLAANLIIVSTGQVTIGQNVNFKGAVYAPGGNVAMANSATVTGMLVGNVVGVSNHYTVNYDPTAAQNTPYSLNLTALAEAVDWRDL